LTELSDLPHLRCGGNDQKLGVKSQDKLTPSLYYADVEFLFSRHSARADSNAGDRLVDLAGIALSGAPQLGRLMEHSNSVLD
jgi:hypothetical protein